MKMTIEVANPYEAKLLIAATEMWCDLREFSEYLRQKEKYGEDTDDYKSAVYDIRAQFLQHMSEYLEILP